jgi:hypothetical protein
MPSLPSVLSLIPFTSVKSTICFTFAALLIILAWRVAYIDLPKAGIHIGFCQNQTEPASQTDCPAAKQAPISHSARRKSRPTCGR